MRRGFSGRRSGFGALWGLLTVISGLSGCEHRDVSHPSTSVSEASGAVWVVDPAEPGPTLPPKGRSLFDHLVTTVKNGRGVYEVPFPFTALLSSIDRHLAASEANSPLIRLLIPVNRSLQRHAADGAFFAYPRAVVGVDTEAEGEAGVSGPLLKDRLFIGYHERAHVLEVISYNETAGRFEFQVVDEYREGGTPVVRYANRALCTACHQNQSPIFSRPLWDETNANPKVAALLAAQGRDFYGFPIQLGVGVPQAFDESTDRANGLAITQWLWQQGCERKASPAESIDCRAELTRWLLQYLLSGRRAFEWRSAAKHERFASSLSAAWRDRWPNGIAIPDPDIPNRDPFTVVEVQTFPGLTPVQATALEGRRRVSSLRGRHEPTALRDPLRLWYAPRSIEDFEAILVELSRFITVADVVRLDRLLSMRGQEAGVASRLYKADCIVRRIKRPAGVRRLLLHCTPDRRRSTEEAGGFGFEGSLDVRGETIETGHVEDLFFDEDETLGRASVIGGLITPQGDVSTARLQLADPSGQLQARRENGDLIRELRVEFPIPTGGVSGERARAVVLVRNEFSLVESALDVMVQDTDEGRSDVFAGRPFRRVQILASLDELLGASPVNRCCLDDRDLPPLSGDLEGVDHANSGESPGHVGDLPAGKFQRYCGACHHGEDAFPPNFLHGSRLEVDANLRRCAERIAYRLEMWSLPDLERPEAPMPPATHVIREQIATDRWSGHEDFHALRKTAREWVAEKQGLPYRQEEFLQQHYDTLPVCRGSGA